jgi:hypothetical protein
MSRHPLRLLHEDGLASVASSSVSAGGYRSNTRSPSDTPLDDLKDTERDDL